MLLRPVRLPALILQLWLILFSTLHRHSFQKYYFCRKLLVLIDNINSGHSSFTSRSFSVKLNLFPNQLDKNRITAIGFLISKKLVFF